MELEKRKYWWVVECRGRERIGGFLSEIRKEEGLVGD